MSYTSNSKSNSLDELTSLETGDLVIVADADDSYRAKKITKANLLTDLNTALTIPDKAAGTDLDTGTNDALYATSKAIKDSHNVPSVAPSTSGNLITSNGTDWVSSAYIPNTISAPWSALGLMQISYSDVENIVLNTTTSFGIAPIDGVMQRRVTTLDWAEVDTLRGLVMIGSYVYVLMQETGAAPDAWRVYRYSKSDLSAGATQMTFAGAVQLAASDSTVKMTSDGTYFYFSFQAGNSANSYVLAKYSLSGTTLTYVESITCGSAAISDFAVLPNGYIYALPDGDANDMVKFNSSGTLLTTYDELFAGAVSLQTIGNYLYAGYATSLVKLISRLPI